MNYSYRKSLAIALLITSTHTTKPVDYKAVTAAGIAAAVTVTMLYNFTHPADNQWMINQADTKCQSAKKLHNKMASLYKNELAIIENSTTGDLLNTIKLNSSLYDYVNSLDQKIYKIEETMHGLVCLQKNLVTRSPKETAENKSFFIDLDTTADDIDCACTQLQELVTQLGEIRTLITNSADYAQEIKTRRENS